MSAIVGPLRTDLLDRDPTVWRTRGTVETPTDGRHGTEHAQPMFNVTRHGSVGREGTVNPLTLHPKRVRGIDE